MNMNTTRGTLFLAALAAVASGCIGKEIVAEPVTPDRFQQRVKPTEEQMKTAPEVANSINGFGFELLGQLPAPDAARPNMLVSPTSISLNLQTVLAGADGKSRDSLIKALSLSGNSPEVIRQGAYGLVYGLLGGDEATLSIANSVWTIGDANFTPAYLKAVQSYWAEAHSVSDRSAGSVQRINDWVKKNTRDRISKIIDELDPMARVFVINAIAFDGKWQEPFQKDRTEKGPFTTVANRKTEADFMNQSGDYRYAETADAKVVQLNFKDSKFSMVLALPTTGSVADLAKSLKGGEWETLTGKMFSRPGSVRIPKWTFRDRFILNDPLVALGAGPAFTPSKDWLGMSPDLQPEGYIGRVIHKTFVEVDEEGAKAAAVTGTELRATSAPADPPFRFDASKPFLYAIRHNESGALLFVGICGDPTVQE